MTPLSVVLGTRGSKLARWQAEHVQAALEARGARVRLQEITTKGDAVIDVPLAQIGDKGLFTKELDVAILEGRIHAAVHSLKDLPSRLPEGLHLAAVTAREVPWDAFVAHPRFSGHLADLPEGAVLGTSSLRRQAQLKAWRPDLRVVPVRGNVDTRLAKLDGRGWHGLILAAAGLTRLGFGDRIREEIRPPLMIPAVGQGALAIVCATDDAEHAPLFESLHDAPTAAAVHAERAFLRRLEGGCQVPVAAWGRLGEEGELVLDGCIASVDGLQLVRGQVEGAPATYEHLGVTLAERLLEQGGAGILAGIRR